MFSNNKIDEKEHVIVYGLGNFYKQYEEQINEKYFIKIYIDNAKAGKFYAYKKIISVDKIKKNQNTKILIMIYSIQQCIDVAKELINIYGIDYKNILLGHNIFGIYANEFDFFKLDRDAKICLKKNNIFLKVSSEDEFHNVCEVLIDENYSYLINNDRQDVVIDIGMNIGDATLYFLDNKKVKKVYGYEPFRITYNSACENLKDYLSDSNRLEIFQVGLSGEDNIREITYNKDMSCGQSTISEIRERAYKFYEQNKLINVDNEVIENIQVREASKIIKTIIDNHIEENIVLKVDCEGEEYSIFQNLSDNKILDKINFIMLEWHYKGKEKLLCVLEKSGFSYWCSNKSKDMGLIYAYKP